MKVLMFVDNYPPETNANARIFSELAELIAKKGLNISIITSHPNFPRGKIFAGYKNKWKYITIENNVRVIRVKTYMYPNEGRLIRTLDFLSFGLSSFIFGFFDCKYDLIIGVTPQFFCALSSCLLSIFKNKPFLLIICDLWPDAILSNKMISKGFLFYLIKKIEFFMYDKADKIAILSPFFRNYLVNQNVDSSKIVDFVSGPDEKFYYMEKNKKLLNQYNLKNKIVVGYIGTFGISHNHEDLLSIFRSLTRSDLHLFMVGEGAKKKLLNNLIQEHQITNVTLKDSVRAIEVPEYWSVCDLAIIPLANTKINKTVIPSKILEAMKMGLPILLYTPIGEVTRFFSVSQATWHVESGHIEQLKKLIHSLSREMIEEKREKAIQFSIKFSRETQAQILLNMINIFRKEDAKEYEEI